MGEIPVWSYSRTSETEGHTERQGDLLEYVNKTMKAEPCTKCLTVLKNILGESLSASKVGSILIVIPVSVNITFL